MKLSRIKKACMDEGVIRLYSVEAPGNAVFQWLGTDGALYAVEGCELTLTTLMAIWEIDSKKAANMDMVEDTLRGAVERRLLTDRDADILAGAPAMIDSMSAPPLVMAHIGCYWAMKFGEDHVMFASENNFAPCIGKHIVAMDIHADDATGEPAWIAVYADGKLCGMVRPTSKIEAERLLELVREVARREKAGRPWEDS